MLLQMGGMLEGLTAVLALIWPFPSVRALVGDEVAAPAISFATLVTLVGSLACVNPHVDLQGGKRPESVSAVATVKGLLFQVGSRVAPERRGVVEGLAAVAALIGLLPSMYPPVPREGRARGEGLVALLAFVHSSAIVQAHRLGHMGPTLESHRAAMTV